jgi:hypothetical protein
MRLLREYFQMHARAKFAIVLATSAVGLTGHSAFAQYSVTTVGSQVVYETFDNYSGYGNPNANWNIGVSNNAGSVNDISVANTQYSLGLDDGTHNSSFLTATYIGNNVVANSNSGSYNTGWRAYYNGTTTNRALGFIGSSGLNNAVATASFVNSTGSALTSLTLQYTGEVFRLGGRDSTFLVSYSLDGTNFTNVPGWEFDTTAASNGNGGTLALIASGATPNNLALNGYADSAVVSAQALLSIPAGQTFYIRWNYSGGVGGGNRTGIALDNVALTVTNTPINPNTVTWTGSSSRLWNTTDGNWTGGVGSLYTQQGSGSSIIGDNVVFGSAGAGPVTVAASGVTPFSVTFNGGAYTLSGGPIQGQTSVSLTGGTSLTLASSNTYIGGTIIDGGSAVTIAATGALSTGAVDLENGTLATTVNSSAKGFLFTGNSVQGTLTAAAGTTLTFTGASSAPALAIGTTAPTLTVTGPGAVVFSGAFASTGVSLNVQGGTLYLNQPSGTTNVIADPLWGSATSGNVVVGGPWRFNLTDNGTGGDVVGSPGTTGKIILTTPSIVSNSQLSCFTVDPGSFTGSGRSFTVYDNIVLQGTSNASVFAVGSVGAVTYGTGAVNTVTAQNILNLYGAITGTGTLYFASTTSAETTNKVSTNYVTGSLGIINLFSTSTYTGDTFLAGDASGIVRAEVNNPFPTTTLFHFGDTNLNAYINVGSLDLNGNTVTVGGLTGTPYTGTTQTFGGVVNTNGAGILALSGSGNNSYGGPIGVVMNTIGLNLSDNGNTTVTTAASFTGTQTFTGAIVTNATVSAGSGKFILAPIPTAVVEIGTLATTGTGVISVAATNRPTLAQSVIVVGSFSPAGGNIDLGNNDAIVTASTVAAVAAQYEAWYQHGAKSGTGLAASGSGAFADPRDAYAALGIIGNDDGTGNPLYATFDGVAVTSSDVLAKYTYIGDTNLDGIVDANDLANALAGLNGHLTGWENGDFTYSGSVTTTDITLLLTSLSAETSSFGDSTGPSGAVPEPTALTLGAIALPLLGRRRRA